MVVSSKNTLLVFLIALSAAFLPACGGDSSSSVSPVRAEPFGLLETTVADIHAAFKGEQLDGTGQALSCVGLAEQYLARIAALDVSIETGLPIN